MQEYRYALLVGITRFFELFGMHRPTRIEQHAAAGDYDHALNIDHIEAPSLLENYLDPPILKVGGPPKETAAGAQN